MFKEFKFGNFRSFRENQDLSMEASNLSKPELDCFNIAEFQKDRILKSAVIYGHNSFGKSNIFKALSKMKEIIMRCTTPEYKINIDNFKLNNYSKNEPSYFEISMIIKDVTYRYGFSVFNTKIIKEWLFKKNVREVNVFNRDINLEEKIKPSTSYLSLKKYIKFTREEELFLSSMIKLNEQGEIKDIYDWIINNLRVISGDSIDSNITSSILSDKELEKEAVVKALKQADLGIEDIEILEEERDFESMPSYIKLFIKESTEKGIPNEPIITLDEVFKHKVFSENKKLIGLESFNLEENESQGTIKFYSLIGPIMDSLKNGYTLFIDELDSKLHHSITKYIIELFHDISINTKNAQLIFNTHDVYLLKEDIFRRDQIYFTSKNEYGESELYSLAEFKGLDSKANILAHYLAGNFGSLGSVSTSIDN